MSIDVDLGSDRTEISELVYGLNDWVRDSTTEITGYTFEREGGNRMTGYNWENNASNAGSDWYNHSDNNVVNSAPSSLQSVPGEGIMLSVDHALSGGRRSLVTLPLAGYVAADMDGTVDDADTGPSGSDRWNTVVFSKGSALSLSPDTTDDYVYVDEEVNFLINTYGTADEGGVLAYSLDNEPALWSSTHPLIHPDDPNVAEYVEKSVAASTVVKNLDPSAKVFGPALYGWTAFKSFQDADDWTSSMSSSYTWFIGYYLSQMEAASETAGTRLLDVLDVHWYPEVYADNSSGTSTRITGDDGSGDLADARMQAPRSLWDSSYTESSWIASSSTKGPIYLITRIQSSIDTYYPDTKMAFTEYCYGGQSDYSGGIAQADVLGIFGKYGVYAACFWGEVSGYIVPGYQIYTDYDGNGSTYGDENVDVSNPDDATYSTYASVDSETGQLHLIVINKDSSAQSATISVSDTNRSFSSAKVYGFSEAGGDSIVDYGSVSVSSNSFSYTLPAHSVLHFVFSDTSVDDGIAIREGSSDSTLSILFDTDSGVTYKLQYSTDLSTWSDIGTTTYEGDGGVFEVEVSRPDSPRFWRVVPVE